MLFSRRRKDLFENSPGITRYKIGGVYAITILGAIAGTRFIAFVAFALVFPQIGYPATPSNIGFMILIYLFGLVVYHAGKYYRKSKAST